MKTRTMIPRVIILLTIVLFSCKSTNIGSSAKRDGLSYETAIIARSIRYEYQWINDHYPGSQPQQQALTKHGKKPYDIITIKTASGETLEIYFDISSFFGKI